MSDEDEAVDEPELADDTEEKSPVGSSKETKGSAAELSRPPLMFSWVEPSRVMPCWTKSR
jgi:hypothetical protein